MSEIMSFSSVILDDRLLWSASTNANFNFVLSFVVLIATQLPRIVTALVVSSWEFELILTLYLPCLLF